MEIERNNQESTTSKSVQDLNSQLNNLIGETKEVNQEIDKTNNDAKVGIEKLDTKVDKSINKVVQTCSNLGQIEKEAGDELDKLVLQQAEDLASE